MNGSGGLFFPLQVTPGAKGIYLRDLRGAEELLIEDTGTKELVDFLDSLMQDFSHKNKVQASQIATADRDRVLAMMYLSLYGPKVESTVNCQNCSEKFDLDFSLDELLLHYAIPAAADTFDGIFKIDPGIRFRLPTGEDELLVNAYLPEESEKILMERCLLDGNPGSDDEMVQEKMAEVAPVLSLEMEAICPECDKSQKVHFDIQTFFLTKLKQERASLIREIHLIASQYHWSHKDILELPRNLRKMYASLIQPEN